MGRARPGQPWEGRLEGSGTHRYLRWPQGREGEESCGIHLWDHLGAEGRKEPRVHSSPTLSHHFHKCRKWHGKGDNPLSFAFPADAKEPSGHGSFNL